MASMENLAEIERRLKEKSTSFIYILESGNFHYLTLVLARNIKEDAIMIVFDHHNDSMDFPYQGYTSCGSWIRDLVEENDKIKKVLIVGVGDHEGNFSQNKKIKVLKEEDYSIGKLESYL